MRQCFGVSSPTVLETSIALFKNVQQTEIYTSFRISWRKATSDYFFLILLFCFVLWANIEKRETILTRWHLLISALIFRKRRLPFYSFNLFCLPLFLSCTMTNSINKWLRCSSLKEKRKKKKRRGISFPTKWASWCRGKITEFPLGTEKLRLVNI